MLWRSLNKLMVVISNFLKLSASLFCFQSKGFFDVNLGKFPFGDEELKDLVSGTYILASYLVSLELVAVPVWALQQISLHLFLRPILCFCSGSRKAHFKSEANQ